MKDILPYIVGLTIVGFATMPHIDFVISAPGQYFPWVVVLSGFFGFYLLFTSINPFIKLMAVYSFINMMLSAAPLLSMISYISLIACCYFYLLCSKVRNYTPIFAMLQALLIFNVVMYGLQYIGKDPLFNFNNDIYYGTVGQHMVSASFIVILTASLVGIQRPYFAIPAIVSSICNSAGALISTFVGYFVDTVSRWDKFTTLKLLALTIFVMIGGYFYMDKIEANFSMTGGRWGVWSSTIDLAFKKPLFGYGLGTYKDLFPALGKMITIPWRTAHNCWLQILFETGFVGLAITLCFVGDIVMRLINYARFTSIYKKAAGCLAGLAMIGTNMLFHFPTRTIQAVLIIIFFLSYCEGVVKHGSR